MSLEAICGIVLVTVIGAIGGLIREATAHPSRYKSIYQYILGILTLLAFGVAALIWSFEAGLSKAMNATKEHQAIQPLIELAEKERVIALFFGTIGGVLLAILGLIADRAERHDRSGK